MIKITIRRGGQTYFLAFLKDKDAEKFLKAIHDDKMNKIAQAGGGEDFAIKDRLTVKIEHL